MLLTRVVAGGLAGSGIHNPRGALSSVGDDLERRIAARRNRLELPAVEIDRRIVESRLPDRVHRDAVRRGLARPAQVARRDTVDPRALERTFTIPERTRAIVREFRDAHEKGFMGKDGIRRWLTWGKTIVFAVTKRHAERLAAMLDEHFADLKLHSVTRYADFVLSDVGGGPAPDASAIIKRFKGNLRGWPPASRGEGDGQRRIDPIGQTVPTRDPGSNGNASGAVASMPPMKETISL